MARSPAVVWCCWLHTNIEGEHRHICLGLLPPHLRQPWEEQLTIPNHTSLDWKPIHTLGIDKAGWGQEEERKLT